jgi:hypothetical protein
LFSLSSVTDVGESVGGIEVGVLNVLERAAVELLVPDLETVVTSATPPNSAGLRFSLILISSIELKDGNSSAEARPAIPVRRN